MRAKIITDDTVFAIAVVRKNPYFIVSF